MAKDDRGAKGGGGMGRVSGNQTRAWTYILESPAHLDEAVAAMMAQRSDKQLNPEVLKAQLVLIRNFLGTPNTSGKPIGWQATEDWKLSLNSMSDPSLINADTSTNDFTTTNFIDIYT